MSLLREIALETSSSEDEIEVEYVRNLQNRKKKVYFQRTNRFLTWDENSFLDRFRVSKNVARVLALKLEPFLLPPTTKNFAITPIQQVLIALEYYACGSFQRCIGDTAGVHKSSVSRIIYRVSRAIANMRQEWVSMPQNVQEMEKTATRFYEISAFPKVVGAIDCTHIPIKSPGGEHAENYRNRKLFFSMNVQAICDADMYITNIVARWPGSSHDSHIFNSSVIKGRLEDGEFAGYWLLGDKGYAIKPYLLTPLRDPVTDGEKLYNESQIRTRNVVERMFGCWKKRFPALSMKIRTDLRRVQPITVATAVLHNICKKMRDPVPPARIVDDDSSDEEDPAYEVNRNDENNRRMLINNYFNRLHR
ncbi:putative nuclease HARBI1 [Plutella xylostella]|uniref:putative nuclease HARBI1 n=1 Tax=Plutella xylostella TaxID=51655 RepID=UPI002032D575|nr:putative nuclease HARBI1 [Plutella xylostella]